MTKRKKRKRKKEHTKNYVLESIQNLWKPFSFSPIPLTHHHHRRFLRSEKTTRVGTEDEDDAGRGRGEREGEKERGIFFVRRE